MDFIDDIASGVGYISGTEFAQVTLADIVITLGNAQRNPTGQKAPPGVPEDAPHPGLWPM